VKEESVAAARRKDEIGCCAWAQSSSFVAFELLAKFRMKKKLLKKSN
jgi:hypothetical protein